MLITFDTPGLSKLFDGIEDGMGVILAGIDGLMVASFDGDVFIKDG